MGTRSDRLRCQSCGMPVSPGFYGTNEDRSETQEFCKFCFQRGEFTKPNMALNEMILLSVNHMISDLGLSREEAETIANANIPELKRWKNRG